MDTGVKLFLLIPAAVFALWIAVELIFDFTAEKAIMAALIVGWLALCAGAMRAILWRE